MIQGNFLVDSSWLRPLIVTCLLDLFHEDDDRVVRNRDAGLSGGGFGTRDRVRVAQGSLDVGTVPATRPL